MFAPISKVWFFFSTWFGAIWSHYPKVLIKHILAMKSCWKPAFQSLFEFNCLKDLSILISPQLQEKLESAASEVQKTLKQSLAEVEGNLGWKLGGKFRLIPKQRSYGKLFRVFGVMKCCFKKHPSFGSLRIHGKRHTRSKVHETIDGRIKNDQNSFKASSFRIHFWSNICISSCDWSVKTQKTEIIDAERPLSWPKFSSKITRWWLQRRFMCAV